MVKTVEREPVIYAYASFGYTLGRPDLQIQVSLCDTQRGANDSDIIGLLDDASFFVFIF